MLMKNLIEAIFPFLLFVWFVLFLVIIITPDDTEVETHYEEPAQEQTNCQGDLCGYGPKYWKLLEKLNKGQEEFPLNWK